MKKFLLLYAALFLLLACPQDPEPDPDPNIPNHDGDADGDNDGDGDGDTDPEERVDLDGNPCVLFDEPGPFEVGVRELQLNNGTAVAVFYPADESIAGQARAVYDMRDFMPEANAQLISDEETPLFEMNAVQDAPLSDAGPFEVVLFSHGLAGYRYQSSTLLSHLASWGFVVASPEHEERNLARVLEFMAPDGDNAADTLAEVLQLLHTENANGSSPFAGRLDLDQVGATGHSMGGNGAGAMLSESTVRAAIFYASAREITDSNNAHLMWMGGTNDALARATQVEYAFDRAPSPRRLLQLEDAGHLAFSDLCAVGEDRGGVLQIAVDNGIEVPPIIQVLGRDGCRDDDLHYSDAWPVIHHYSVAHLRHAFGIDDEPVGLSPATVGCFQDSAELSWSED